MGGMQQPGFESLLIHDSALMSNSYFILLLEFISNPNWRNVDA